MVTVEQILAAEGYELGDLLGQVLKPDEYEWDQKGVSHKIALTWDNAMKRFEASLEKHGKAEMLKAMKAVYVSETGDTNGADYLMNWWPWHAGEKGHLKASAICEINNA